MRVKFHIPDRAPSIRAIQENAAAEGNPSEGPVYSEGARRSEGGRYQRGGSRSSRYAGSEGGEGATSSTRPTSRFNLQPVKKSKKVFARSRKIKATKVSSRSQDFGPFSDIVVMSNEGLDITNVNQAKRMLSETGLVPVTLKFFIDTAEIKNRKITSAEVSFEKPSDETELPIYTGAVIRPAELNLEFHQAGARRKQKIFQTHYVNFESVYDLNEDIEYSISMSPNRLKIFENIPSFAGGNFVNKIMKEPVQIPLAVDNIIESYAGNIETGR